MTQPILFIYRLSYLFCTLFIIVSIFTFVNGQNAQTASNRRKSVHNPLDLLAHNTVFITILKVRTYISVPIQTGSCDVVFIKEKLTAVRLLLFIIFKICTFLAGCPFHLPSALLSVRAQPLFCAQSSHFRIGQQKRSDTLGIILHDWL